MADSDKTLSILIQLGVIGKEDVEKVREALNAVQGQTKGLAEEAKNATAEGEKFSLSQRETGHVLREIGEQALPGAGRALGELRLGLLGVALAAGTVFEGIREQIKKTNEAMDEMAARAAQAYAGVKTNLFDAIRAEEFSTEKIDKYFQHLEQAEAETKSLIEDSNKLAEAQLSGSERRQKAEEQLALARVKANPELNDQQKEIASAEIKKHYADLTLDNEKQRNQLSVTQAAKELEATQNAQTKLEIQKRNLEAASDQERVEKAMASPEVDKALKAEYEREKAAGTIDYSKILGAANAKNAEQTVSSLKDKLGLDDKGNVTGGDAKDLADATAHLETMKRIANGLKATNPASGKEFEQNEVKTAQDAVDRAQAAVDQDKKALQQAETLMAIASQTEAYNKKLNEELEKLGVAVESATEKLKNAHSEADIKNAAATAATQTEAQATAIEEAAKRMAGKDPNAVIAAGAKGQDDINELAREGFGAKKIASDYARAIQDQRTPGAFTGFDQQAIGRFQRYTADANAARDLAALLTTMGEQGAEMRAIILNHLQLHTTTVSEVQALKNALAVLTSQVQAITEYSGQ
jgi:hypothetical protein